MGIPAFDPHHDGLGHLAGDDFADALFALPARFQVFRFFSHVFV
jgi:hypothetical protein